MLPGVGALLASASELILRCDPVGCALVWLNCVIQYNVFHHPC